MKKTVAAAGVVALGADFDERAVVVLVADVEELDEGVEAVRAPSGEVGFYVVEGAEEAREGDVACVVKASFAADEDAVLGLSALRGVELRARRKVEKVIEI